MIEAPREVTVWLMELLNRLSKEDKTACRLKISTPDDSTSITIGIVVLDAKNSEDDNAPGQ